ncbi:Mannitol repressor [Mesonia phycicola]|uniref:Mannitol repressor n=2 Tax=Mesonia phycicola TaxID=579105 RepID=A0A1M6HRH3_9FLAO|nr:Mannitol repressor [Mesonia phycicola]
MNKVTPESILKAKLLIEVLSEKLIDVEPDLEPFLYNTARVREQLINESDRGCVILAVSFLETILTDLLKGKLIGSKKHFKNLFDFSGPLGTFSSKIKMSYSIGLISESEKTDLENIRSLRNIFAHSPNPTTLDDNEPKKIIEELKLDIRKRENDTPRRKFISVTWYIISVMGITSKLEKLKYNRTDAPIDINTEKENRQALISELKSVDKDFPF